MSIQHKIVVPKRKPLPKKLEGNPLGTPSISIIVGQTGSGKSVIVANLLMALQNLHEFDTGLFVTDNNKDPILDSIELPIANTPQQLSEYITELKQAKEGTNHILVLDDIHWSHAMKLFWAKVDSDKKYDITEVGHSFIDPNFGSVCGTGLVDFSGKVEIVK